MTGGSSTLPCSDTFAYVQNIYFFIHFTFYAFLNIFSGPSRDSELETQALENAILKKKGDWDAYLTIHT
jgi:hypothetical protein